VKQDDLEQLRDLVEKLSPRPLAKVVRDPRDAFRSEFRAAFVAAVDYLLTLPGYSMRSIARELGCDHVTLADWVNSGDTRRCQIPGWVLRALPQEGRVVFMRHMLGWSNDNDVERTGTGG
jgi:hypothetical protein